MTDIATAGLHDNNDALDPLGDAEEGLVKNRAKVGSARPSSLLYTYGPGAIMDLPNFSVMPAGLDHWEPIWKRRESIQSILEPRLLNVVRMHLGAQVDALRLKADAVRDLVNRVAAVADGAAAEAAGAMNQKADALRESLTAAAAEDKAALGPKVTAAQEELNAAYADVTESLDAVCPAG